MQRLKLQNVKYGTFAFAIIGRTIMAVTKLFLIVSLVSGQSGVLIPSPLDRPDPTKLSIAVMKVDILIDNQHATVKVMQIFDNHTAGTLEGKYIFALPQSSSISDFAVWDDTTRIPGVMMEKRRANAIYGQIKQAQTDPGILQTTDESATGTGFSAKIFPINAYGTKRLEMEYSEELAVDALTSQFVLPLKPSFGESESVGEFDLSIRVVGDFPIVPVADPQPVYPLQIVRSEPNEFAAAYHASNLVLTDDFSFGYRLDVATDSLAVIAYRAPESTSVYDLRDPRLAAARPDGYFQANAIFAGGERGPTPPRRVALLLDTSLSIYGDKLTRAVEAIDYFLHTLTPDDQFTLTLFNEDVASYADRPVSATADSVEGAMQFVKASNLGGGTNLKKALETAARQSQDFANGGDPAIVLISDANPTLETTQTRKITAALEGHNVKLFAFALGADTNERLLGELTRKTHGYYEQVRETEDIAARLRLFFDKVSTAGIGNMVLSSPAPGNLYDIYQNRFDSFFGSDVSFIGRYRGGGRQSFALTARHNGETLHLVADKALPELDTLHGHLPRLWAKARIDALLAIIDLDGEREDLISEIISLSEKYKLVTPYTAFLAAPRALLRPRLIQPGDPVIRVKTDPSVTEVFAVLPFGETLPLKFLPGEGVWETRFLAPVWMVDGTYKCRLLLTDRDGNGYQEEKSFVIDSRAPVVKVTADKSTYSAGDPIALKASADSDTVRLTARVYGAKPIQLRWSGQAQSNMGMLMLPAELASGRYVVTVTAEDFAHNQSTTQIEIEVIGK